MINQVITYGVLHSAMPPRLHQQRNEESKEETSDERTFNLALKINNKLGGVNCEPITSVHANQL